MAGELFVGEAEGRLDGSGTICSFIRNAIPP